jgi:hypothetical protein
MVLLPTIRVDNKTVIFRFIDRVLLIPSIVAGGSMKIKWFYQVLPMEQKIIRLRMFEVPENEETFKTPTFYEQHSNPFHPLPLAHKLTMKMGSQCQSIWIEYT